MEGVKGLLAKKSVLIGAGATAVVALGLGLGLGLGLRPKEDTTPKECKFDYHVKMAQLNESYYELDGFEYHIEASHPHWVHANHHYLSCVDPRNIDGMIGTPGGEIAEFIIGVNAKLASRKDLDFTTSNDKLDLVMLEEMRNYINENNSPERPFFYHTGQDYLINALNYMGQTSFPYVRPINNLSTWLDALSDVTAQGCSHLKYMLLEPEIYKVPYGVVRSAIKTVYKLQWESKYAPKMLIHNYQFKMKPKGILVVSPNEEVEMPAECAELQPELTPTIYPETLKQKSAFIFHKHFIEEFRTTVLAPYFMPSKAEETAKALNTLADKQLERTIEHIAYGLPIAVMEYEATLEAASAGASGAHGAEAPAASGGH